MKKLMTMLAAVGLSFGLFAETTFPNGTSFESNTAGDNTVELLNAKESGATWVASADASATLTVTDYIAAGQTPITAEAKRPAQFAMATQNNFLEIKSAFDKPFVRTLETALTKGDAGYYIDTLVRFTLADDTIEVSDASAKLAVYVKAIDAEGNEDGQTNLVVVANKVDAQGQKTVTHFDCVCDADVADGKWHRLTIKAIDDITNGDDVPGFVVFVDNEIVSSKTETPIASAVKDEVSVWANNKQLFCSLYPSSATITGLAIAGQGGIDDISFTQDVPFAAARDYGTLTVNFTGDAAKMASFKVTAGSVDYDATAAQLEVGSMVIPLQGDLPKTINIAWTAKPGYKSGFETGLAVDDKGVVTVPENTVKGLVARFEEEYDNIAEAVNAANTSATNGTLTLLANADGAMAFANASKTITVDLNGHQALAISAAAQTAVVIDDSSDGKNGTVEGVLGGSSMGWSITVNAGKIKYEGNEGLATNSKIKAKSGCKFNKNGDYWEVKTIDYVTLTVIKDSNVAAVVVSNETAGVDVALDSEGKAKFDKDDAAVVKAYPTFAQGYELDPSSSTLTAMMTADATINIVSKSAIVTYTVDWTGSQNVVVSNDTVEVSGTQADFEAGTVLTFYATVGMITNVTVGGVSQAATNPWAYTVTDQVGQSLIVLAGEKSFVPGEDIVPPPGKTADQYADDINKDPSLKAKLLKAPGGVETTADYRELFEAVAGANVVTFEFTENAEETLEAQATADAALALADDDITITAVKGLYYGLSEAGALDQMKVTDAKQATGEKITFTPDKTGAAGFWKIIVSATEITVPDPE